MRVFFEILDGRQKRWFPKVAKAAAERVNSFAEGFAFDLPGLWGAGFSLVESEQTLVRHTIGRDDATTEVIFAAANWQGLDSAVGDATEQLASALLRVVPRERVAELRGMFNLEGVPHLRRVRVSRENAPEDPRFHAIIYFNAPGFDLSRLHRLYDELDIALQDAGCGEVNGSGVGLGGYSLDVSLWDREAGLRRVFAFLGQQDLKPYARVRDLRAGEDLNEHDVA